MVQRQFPKPSELKEFMTFKKPSLDFAGNRLEKALTIYRSAQDRQSRTQLPLLTIPMALPKASSL